MTIAENKSIVIRFNKEFLEQGNTGVLPELVAADFINHTVAGGIPNDVEGLRQFVTMLHTGFSDLYIDIVEQVGEGDIVATRKTIQATHTGVIMGRPGTGKKVTINVMDFVRIRDGKYVEHWGQNNLAHVIQSL